MARLNENEEEDRFLRRRGGTFYYRRRVPAEYAGLDARHPHIYVSLKTRDLAVARARRDLFARADEDLWASLSVDGENMSARQRHSAAVKRAAAMGFSYRPAAEVALESVEERLRRIEAVMAPSASRHEVAAVLGKIDRPDDTIKDALDL